MSTSKPRNSSADRPETGASNPSERVWTIYRLRGLTQAAVMNRDDPDYESIVRDAVESVEVVPASQLDEARAEVKRLRGGVDQIVGDIRDATEWSAQERWRVMNRLDDLLHPSEEKEGERS